MVAIFLLLILLWAGGHSLGIHETLTAFIGLCLLLRTGVLEWEDVKGEKGAWDTLVWFSVLVMLANQMNAKGMIPWFSREMGLLVSGAGGFTAMTVLALIYFYSHYLVTYRSRAPWLQHFSCRWSALYLPWGPMCWPGSAACSAA